jgi:hypothetical protein
MCAIDSGHQIVATCEIDDGVLRPAGEIRAGFFFGGDAWPDLAGSGRTRLESQAGAYSRGRLIAPSQRGLSIIGVDSLIATASMRRVSAYWDACP